MYATYQTNTGRDIPVEGETQEEMDTKAKEQLKEGESLTGCYEVKGGQLVQKKYEETE